MHCPQCGQQQVSGELRFCSRCGFPLGGVTELLANGGSLPVLEQPATAGKKRRSPRYEGVRQGVMLLFLGAVLVPLLGILYSYNESNRLLEVIVPISAVLFFIGGFLRMMYAALFEEAAPATYMPPKTALPYVPPVAPERLGAPARGTALPPAQSIPVSNWRQHHNTAEIVRPPSVTEHTTRLLDDAPDRDSR
jgi:hypothetical protein